MAKAATASTSKTASRRQINSANRNTFAFVLYDILERGTYECLKWSDDGTRVVITSRNAVIKDVLTNHFDTLKFDSFTRQFHIYEFIRTTDNRRTKHPEGYCEFYQPNFQRGRPDLLSLIPRKKASRSLASGEALSERNSVAQRIRMSTLNDGSEPPTMLPTDASSSAPVPAAMFRGMLPANVVASVNSDAASYAEAQIASAQRGNGPGSAGAGNAMPREGVFAHPDAQRVMTATQEVVDLLDFLHPEVLKFVRDEYLSIVQSIEGLLENAAIQWPPASDTATASAKTEYTQSPGDSPRSGVESGPQAVSAFAPVAMPPSVFTGAPMEIVTDIDPTTPGPSTAPVLRTAFFSEALPIRDPLTALPPTGAHTSHLFSSLATPSGMPQHSQGLLVSAHDIGGTSPIAMHIQAPAFADMPPVCRSFQLPHPASMAVAPASVIAGAPAGVNISFLYPPPSAGDHMLPMLEMLQPMSFDQLSAVLPSTGADAGAGLMPMDVTASAGWGLGLPGTIPASARMRGISSPANIFSNGFPPPQ